MKKGDLVVVPSKIKPIVHVGKITSDYIFEISNEPLYRHIRLVVWLKELLRKDIDQDLLYSFGVFMTICQIASNDAESRIMKIIDKGAIPKVAPQTNYRIYNALDISEGEKIDIEADARQEISDRLIAKYKGHGILKVIEDILESKVYTTFVSPPGLIMAWTF